MENNLRVTIGGRSVDVTKHEDLPVSISYALEDPGNFQVKKSATALSLKVPPTLGNESAGNAFHNPDMMDLTSGEAFRRNQPCVIEAGGEELLVGKAFMKVATHKNGPIGYTFDLYGDNADWVIDLQERTLFDLLKHISFTFDKATIEESWNFTGNEEGRPFVFAPVKYRGPMGGYQRNTAGDSVAVDNNMETTYLRPSLSAYWLLYWGFKSVGYRMDSVFLQSSYFKRKVMPWTWGNFIDSDGTRLNTHRFLAKGSQKVHYAAPNGRVSEIWNLFVDNDTTQGAFDNNNDYTWDAPNYVMIWSYNPPHYGRLEANLLLTIEVEAFVNQNSDVELRVQWFRNGVQFDGGFGPYNANGNLIMGLASSAGIGTGRRDYAIHDMFGRIEVNPGDWISARVYKSTFESKAGDCWVRAQVIQYKMDYFRIPLGGIIDFENYTGLQKYKFLDFFRGIVDTFNLSLNTDAVNKVVCIEPTHPYALTSSLTATQDGYMKADHIAWDGKEDLSKEWEMENFSDYEREVVFCFADDPNDGILKKIQDRHLTKLAASKYVFPDRFKQGRKEITNRFFSPVMHYEVEQWKGITGEAPQLVCIIPENISNTSNTEANNTFAPKLCHYKGLTSGVGGWRFDGQDKTTLPFLFAVNYKAGGAEDPVLSYSDERVKGTFSGEVVAYGLLRRFFLQRLAIMRNGQWYNAWLRLNNRDVKGLHREHKSLAGHRWELVQIRDYKPLLDESTACFLRRWAPVEKKDADSVFPSATAVMGTPVTSAFDTKYAPLKGLPNDIPTN